MESLANPSHRPPRPAALRRIAAATLLALAMSLFVAAPPARAASFTVTTTADSGAGSLRDAIAQANSNPGADTISFAIPGAGVQTIAPATPLPAITDRVTIDGATQSGANCASWPPTLKIELTGTNIITFGAGLALTGPGASGSTIRGLTLNNFAATGNGAGISHAINITNSSGNAIECTFSYTGIEIDGTSSGNRIGTNGDGVTDTGEGNLICADQFGRAITTNPGSSQTIIAGNYIGTDVTGTQAPCAGQEMVTLFDDGGNRIGTNGDGLADAAERNIIVGGQAIFIPGSDNNVIAGNYINVDATGSTAFPSSQGIYVTGNNNRIGTDGSNDAFNAAERNVITAGGVGSVGIQVFGAHNTVIAGNYIGINSAGTAGLGNGFGVTVSNGASNTRIGTNNDGVADSLEGNVIGGGSGDGIQIANTESSFTNVEGNYIGTNPTGTVNLGNDGNGISVVAAPRPITISRNLIRFNNGAGVLLVDEDSGTTIRANSIDANRGGGIISPGRSFPIISRTVPSGSSLRATGLTTGNASTAYTLDFYASPSCDPSFFGQGRTFLGSQQLTTNAGGVAEFDLSFTPDAPVPFGQFVTATSTGPSIQGSTVTSAFSNCSSAGPGNDAWPRAYGLSSGTAFSQPIDLPGQSRWFTLPTQPGSRVVINLTGADGGPLPAGYDLTVYKDISQAFTSLTSPSDLTHLSAEFAGDGFNNDTLAPDALNPARIAPQAFSPQAFSPQAFSPQAFSPQAFSPQAFSPQAFSPQAFSPQAFSPQAFSPQAFSPQAFSPQAFSPEQLAYANAQVRSVIGVASLEGTAPRTLTLNTWNNTGELYVQVRGQNGAFTPLAPFQVQATVLGSECPNVHVLPAVDPSITGSFSTVILADLARVEGSAAEKDALLAKLQTLAQRENGVLLDVGDSSSYTQVKAARAEAANNTACPFAKTQLAEKIKALYRNVAGLKYVVIVGNDEAIPFFRSPDNSPLGPESNYEPPLLDNSAARASLGLNYILSQDAYGSRTSISLGNDSVPVPQIPVGRLVETASNINTVLDAYLGLASGVVPTPTSALVTGYDFLEDAANSVRTDLTAGLGTGGQIDTLISPSTESFLDPNAWTADSLRAKLLGSRHDLVFLAGHFSAASTLAADYRTTLDASEVAASSTNLTNIIVWSAGCHSGYNLVNSAGVPNVTREPDWAQAFAGKGATLIAGTGYQYGDTDFLAYSERIYAEFTRQLRVGSGPVAIGDALVAAKQAYLTSTPQLQGIDDKALRIATIYGLPMLKINMPGQRIVDNGGGLSSLNPSVVGTGPGSNPAVSLRAVDLPVTTGATIQPAVQLKNVDDGSTVSATYYSGPDGIVVRPSEPVLPLKRVNVGVSSTVLRGVGFRGGSYADTAGVRPLVSAPSFDLRGVHVNFAPPVFWPVKPYAANYFGALIDPASGTTELQITPTQFRTSSPTAVTGTRRVFSSMDFRLFYSAFLTSYPNGSAPALSNGPTIAKIDSSFDATGTITFTASVAGDPAAGVQGVWVTWTDPTAASPRWQSLDLSQSASDSTQWSKQLSVVNPANIRYMVQAVSALGVVTLADNLGAYYTPGSNPAALPEPAQQAATLALTAAPASGAYGTQATFSAKLTSASGAAANRTVVFSLGGQSKLATTNSSGSASATLDLLAEPGQYQAGVSFLGDSGLAPAADSASFTIAKQSTTLTLAPASASVAQGAPSGMVATLADASGTPLALRTVFFTVGTLVLPITTNGLGQAALGVVDLPPGSYSVRAAFGTTSVAGVTQTDSRYNGSTSTSGTLTISGAADTTAPVITPAVTGTLGQNGWYTSNVGVSWVVSDPESAISSSTGCGPVSITADTAGTTLTCSATSAGGTSSQSVTVKRDATAPVVTIGSKPAAQTNSTSASFTFSSSESASLACKLDAGAFAPCASPQSYTGLAAGPHTFTVQATDPAGNVGSVAYSWAVDTVAPTVTITSAPPASTSSTSASFSFTSSEAATFACKLDAGAFAPCASPQSYTNLAAGPHTFTVQATDPAGNVGSAAYSWTITATATFPQNGIRDNFNRANGGVGSNWEGLTSTTYYAIASNRLDVQSGGPLVWKPSSFGTSQEAFVTLSAIDTKSASQGLLLKVQTGTIPTSGAISVVYDAVAKAVRVSTLRLNTPTWTLYAGKAATFANGDQLGAQALANGDVKIYKNGTLIATVTLNSADKSFFNAKGGKIGLWSVGASNTLFDDFGGGGL